MNDIFLIGEVGFEITLETVVKAVKDSDKSKPLNVNIHSPGGSVFDGIAIYNYLKGLDQEVNTAGVGLVASIATVFFLAGKKETRKVNSTDPFLIHLPKGGAFGNAEDLEKTAEELRDIENTLADIYVHETSLTKKEAIDLMEKDEMLPVDFLLEKGFVSEVVELKAVATFDKFNKYRMGTQAVTKKEVEGLFAGFEKKFNKFFNNNAENKTVKDANGIDIVFPDLKKDDNVSVGAEALIDNKKPTGEWTTKEGAKWTFVNGKLDAIVEEETDLEKLKIENSSLKDEIQQAATDLQEKTDELEAKETLMATLQTDFTAFKGEITSKFAGTGKSNQRGAGDGTEGKNEQGTTRTPINKE